MYKFQYKYAETAWTNSHYKIMSVTIGVSSSELSIALQGQCWWNRPQLC